MSETTPEGGKFMVSATELAVLQSVLLQQRDALLEACEGLIFSGERMHLGEGRIELWGLAIGRAKAAIEKARK